MAKYVVGGVYGNSKEEAMDRRMDKMKKKGKKMMKKAKKGNPFGKMGGGEY